MNGILLLSAVVIIACVLVNKISFRFGVPMLLAFIGLGMLFGSDGIFKIAFADYKFVEQICSAALILIMFYGGFGTKASEAKPVAVQAVLLSSLGTILTAGLTGLFCYFILRFHFLESMLIGAVLSSTDAASVFSILRSQKLNLKYNTASMLEVESGSNDPFAYMLTVILLTLMRGGGSTFGEMLLMIGAQLVFGILGGVLIAWLAGLFMRRFTFTTSGFDAAFVLAVAVMAYALPSIVGGNGYLSTYIVGILLGNQRLPNKKVLIHFFDGLTGLMQMLIFFLLGLLAFPSQMPGILLPSIAIALFLTFAARPAAVCAILSPARSKLRQQMVVSWAGLRGAASIVFAIMATVDEAYTKNDIFHITFCVVLFSIAFQGTLLPLVAKKVDMLDESGNVLKTFNDYSDEVEVQFARFHVKEKDPWLGMAVKDISMPPEMLLVMIFRNGDTIVPNGDTKLLCGDTVVLSAPALQDCEDILFQEISVDEKHLWNRKRISEIDLPAGKLVIMIKRGENVVIPQGKTMIMSKDILVTYSKG